MGSGKEVCGLGGAPLRLLFLFLGLLSLTGMARNSEELSSSHRPKIDLRAVTNAARAGSRDAQKQLAQVLYTGKGTQRNLEWALYWWWEVAKSGDVGAQYTLGLLYETGDEGVPTDRKVAEFWYQAAADQGSELAQYRLAQLYEAFPEQFGKGKDVIVRLYDDSGKNGHLGAKTRHYFFTQMETLEKTKLEKECAICLEGFDSNEEVSLTQCGHLFHPQCISSWKNKISVCPECQGEI